jgi:hypothetical protein
MTEYHVYQFFTQVGENTVEIIVEGTVRFENLLKAGAEMVREFDRRKVNKLPKLNVHVHWQGNLTLTELRGLGWFVREMKKQNSFTNSHQGEVTLDGMNRLVKMILNLMLALNPTFKCKVVKTREEGIQYLNSLPAVYPGPSVIQNKKAS